MPHESPWLFEGQLELNDAISEVPVELVDLYPTIASWETGTCDETLPGTDLLRKKMTEASRATALIRNGGQVLQFAPKNTESPDGGKKEHWGGSYDHVRDPKELNNVASDVAYAATFDSLRHLLLQADSFIRSFRQQQVENSNAEPLPEQNRL